MKTFQIAEAACAIVVGVLLYSADILACSCNTRTGLPDDVPALLAAADLAFAGRVVEVEEYTSDEVETAPCIESWPHHVVVVDVDRVWKGDVPERVSLLSVIGGSNACGLAVSVGDERVFFTQDDEGFPGPRADICTTPNATSETVEEFAVSVPPRSGQEDRVEVCRRQSPESPKPADSCGSAGGGTTGAVVAVVFLPWAYARSRRRSSTKFRYR